MHEEEDAIAERETAGNAILKMQELEA